MKAKTILNTSGALVTLGGATVGSYYALNNKASTNPSSLSSRTEQGNSKLNQKTNKRISEWLKIKTNKSMLPFHSVQKDPAWDNKWTKFQKWYEENENINHDWKIFDWVRKKENGEGYRKLQELCKSNSEKETDNEGAKLINEVIQHCLEE